GTPVYAIAAGKVASFNYWDGTGYVVYVYHNINGVKYTSVYEHLDRYNTYVGAIVDKNTVIAFSGNTGNSTGPHLHLSILNGWAGIDYILWSNSYFNNNLNPITKINFPSGQYWNNRTTWYK
ncbi:MAG: M23 family metallopeptidase, partial [Bacilli bacterium]|nr:M23 family metallopeptidase [Bacilli bacterium]